MTTPQARLAAAARLDEISSRFGELRDPLGRQQWAQALVDLGYAEPDILERLDADEAGVNETLASALDEFRREWAEAIRPPSPREVGAPPGEPYVSSADPARGELTNFEREALLELVSFDARVVASHMPRAGERGLWSRVLHYRLATLNFYSGSAAAPVGEDTRRGLLMLTSLIGAPAGDVSTLNLLGNASALCAAYSRRHGDEPLIIYASEPATRSYADLECRMEGFGSLARSAAELGLAGRIQERQQLLALRDSRKSAIDRQSEISNWFGLMLVQWRLWTRGYYEGRVDSHFGPRSRGALYEALDDLLEMNPHHQRSDAIVSVGNDLAALNPRFILDEMIGVLLAPRKLEASQFAPILEPVERDLAEGSPAEMALAVERHGFWSRLVDGLKQAARSLYKAGRRIYQGVRDVVVRVADVVRQGLEAVYYGLREATERVRGVFRVVFSRLEHAAKTVGEAFSALAAYMSGSPIVTTSSDGSRLVYSRFSGDADATLVVTHDAEEALQRAHCRRRRALMRAFARALATIGSVIHCVVLILTTGVIGLARLAFDVGETVVRSLRSEALPT